MTTDAALLSTFARTRSEAAFAELVRRHGPLVRGVCRRVLADAPEADDAFQATFLVLARKAGRVRDPGRLGPWLYGVAVRVAGKLRADRHRRRRRERPMSDQPAPQRESDWAEVRPVLDAEVARLPPKLQAALVLCELQGVSREDAVGRLGVPAGTLSSRLARAKELLRTRLVKRGVTLSAAGLGAALGEATTVAAVPAEVAEEAIAAAVAVRPEGSLVTGKLVGMVALLLATGGLGYAGLKLFPGSPADDPALHGRWQTVEMETMGRRRPEPVSGSMRTADLIYEPGRMFYRGSTLRPVLDPSASPKQLDWVADETPIRQGYMWPGIYRVDGDTLTVCVNRKKDGLRPTAFTTPPDDGGDTLLVVYQRYTGPATSEGVPPDGATTELRHLQGRWRVFDPAPPASPTEFRFTSDQLTVTHDAGRPDDRYRIRLDITRSLRRIDLTPLGADGRPAAGPRPLLGVYLLGAEQLAVRWGDADTRPDSLAGGTGPAVYRLDRVKE